MFYNELIKDITITKTMAYRYLEHTTDAFIEVSGTSLEEAFANAGISVIDTMVDIKTVDEKEERVIEITAKDLNNLLYDWLEEIIILAITEGFVARRFCVQITQKNEYFLKAKLYGEEIDFKKHHYKLEIKSPTFHLMEIKAENPITMRFLLDL